MPITTTAENIKKPINKPFNVDASVTFKTTPVVDMFSDEDEDIKNYIKSK